VNSKVIHPFFAPSTVLVMAISAPKYPGCSINGTSTGSCCAVFPVTFSEGLTTCQTSADRVPALESCLKALSPPPTVACTGSASPLHARLALVAVTVSLAITILSTV
jgi:hypothetical protein